MTYKCVIVGNRSRKNAEIRERDNTIPGDNWDWRKREWNDRKRGKVTK